MFTHVLRYMFCISGKNLNPHTLDTHDISWNHPDVWRPTCHLCCNSPRIHLNWFAFHYRMLHALWWLYTAWGLFLAATNYGRSQLYCNRNVRCSNAQINPDLPRLSRGMPSKTTLQQPQKALNFMQSKATHPSWEWSTLPGRTVFVQPDQSEHSILPAIHRQVIPSEMAAMPYICKNDDISGAQPDDEWSW